MSVQFYLLSAGMLLAGFLFTTAPLLRRKRYGVAGFVGACLVVGLVAMYPIASNFQVRSVAFEAVANATTEPEARRAAEALQAELMQAPDNFEGWRLLGRARLELNDFTDAAFAFRQAMRLTRFADPELMVLLGEALTYADGGSLPEEAVGLFLDAYEAAPTNAKAQWYAGLAHAANGDNTAAADAWDALLASGPPPEIAAILSERIATLRGAVPLPAAEQGPALQLQVSLKQDLVRDWPLAARLFVSVRDPSQPGPPLAAVQYSPSELPLALSLDDRNAMIAGRGISSADRYEIVARVSMNGDPLGGPGDYIGRLLVNSEAAAGPLELVINEVAPNE